MDRCISIITKAAPAAAALIVTAALLLAACGGGGSGSSSPGVTPTVAPTLTPAPTPTPTQSATSGPTANPQAFVCPATGTASTVRVASSLRSGEATKRGIFKHRAAGASAQANTLLAVSYNRSTIASSLRQIAGREQALGANLIQSYDFPHQNVAMRVISVPTAKVAQTEALLRVQSGIQSIGVTGERRYQTTTTAYFTNDPYFDGFTAAQNIAASNAQPATQYVAPYEESSAVPGQWDMHAIGLEHAFGYSQTGTTYTSNANALGSSAIKIAIIDTGEDASHPELNSKITYQKCFITNEAGTSQSTGSFSTDEAGHGTDVSGIAAAASNNSFGFTGAGGKAVIYAYRVFPTPDDNCADENTDDAQCSSSTSDIASAIMDAIAQHVNVISMSLGGGGCTNGVDSDTTEGTAISEAIAANIIVVAAAGNAGGQGVTAPACDTGVIAAGATSLADGGTTGTSGNYSSTNPLINTASATNLVEYVPSYSQYGSPGASVHSANAWGIVAPGGDPSSAASDSDDLHWIENIWTSTPFGGQSDMNFAGECTNDYPNGTQSTSPDCRTLIAGTSMATPHVAGAAALILAVNASYQSPAAMKQLLCQTADDILDSHEGCGRLNVYRAMAHAISDSAPP